jgi:hypothetical protein
VDLRGRPYRPPDDEPLYVGTVPDQTLGHLERSVRWRLDRRRDQPT